MPSMIFVRHVCDRCAEMVELEVHPHVETQGKPDGWQYITVDDRQSLICGKCVEGLKNWLGVKPPALSVVQ
jgi:hypothetical protein